MPTFAYIIVTVAHNLCTGRYTVHRHFDTLCVGAPKNGVSQGR